MTRLGVSPTANAQCCAETAGIVHANATQDSEELGASVAVLGNDVVVGAPKNGEGLDLNVGRVITFPIDDPADQTIIRSEDREDDWEFGGE